MGRTLSILPRVRDPPGPATPRGRRAGGRVRGRGGVLTYRSTTSPHHLQGASSLFGTSSTGVSRAISTGHLLADCERWCRDTLRPRETPRPSSALRVVVTPPSLAAQAPTRRGTFR